MNLPDPEVRFWHFKNGMGAAARVSRDMLLAGLIAYEAWVFDERSGVPTHIGAVKIDSGIYPEAFRPISAGSEDEVERLLSAVESYVGGAH